MATPGQLTTLINQPSTPEGGTNIFQPQPPYFVTGEVSNSYSNKIGSSFITAGSNWFKSKPYGFVFYDRWATSSNYAARSYTMYLPILPSNINVTTHFATNVVTTLYGIVEEHSEVRYYDITIAGTTGIAPRWVAERRQDTPTPTIISGGRSAFDNGSVLGDLGGFLPEVTNVVNQVKDAVSDIGDALSGGPKMDTGLRPSQSGYVAFHNLYRFFLKYKNDAAGVWKSEGSTPTLFTNERKIHPITFLNYKDSIKYDCTPISFTLTRSADNPMLYNYSIKLRAYNLRNVDANPPGADQLDKLGLDGLEGQSVFSSLAGAAGSAATLVSAVL